MLWTNNNILAAVDWDELVQSMHDGFDGAGHAINLAIGIGVLVLFWINVRLARWASRKPAGKGR